jgi:alpha-D-ribose 1-methylphosphonate 5-triphosphate diphosphatase
MTRGRRLILRGGDIVTPDRVVTDGALVIEDGRIAEILTAVHTLGGEEVRWVNGLIAPAFVDIHSDALEREILPRPTAAMPVELALTELDRKLAGHGITTLTHAIAFELEEGVRSHGEAERVAEAIRERAGEQLVRHLVHARYEITNVGAAPTIRAMLGRGLVHMVSLMDHTPGGRQFKRAADYVAYYSRAHGLSEERVERMVEERLQLKYQGADALEEALVELVEAARSSGVVLASHDDDSAEQVAWAQTLGVTISEFPVSADAVKAAKTLGLHVVMGAPNVVRGGSTGGNLSALTALRMGGLDSLCSDYYPASLLHAAIALHAEGHVGLPEAFRLVSLNPAGALGLDGELGSIETGKAADLVVIGTQKDIPVVTRTLCEGREVFTAGYS